MAASGEFEHPPDNAERANAGLEYGVSESAFLRGGWYFRYDMERFGVGGGVRIPTGTGLRLQVDYSYTENQEMPGIHRFSVDATF